MLFASPQCSPFSTCLLPKITAFGLKYLRACSLTLIGWLLGLSNSDDNNDHNDNNNNSNKNNDNANNNNNNIIIIIIIIITTLQQMQSSHLFQYDGAGEMTSCLISSVNWASGTSSIS